MKNVEMDCFALFVESELVTKRSGYSNVYRTITILCVTTIFK